MPNYDLMDLDAAYTHAVATLQGIVQQVGREGIAPRFLRDIEALEQDWVTRNQWTPRA